MHSCTLDHPHFRFLDTWVQIHESWLSHCINMIQHSIYIIGSRGVRKWCFTLIFSSRYKVACKSYTEILYPIASTAIPSGVGTFFLKQTPLLKLVIFVVRAKRVCLVGVPEDLEVEALAEALRCGAEKIHLSLELRRWLFVLPRKKRNSFEKGPVQPKI